METLDQTLHFDVNFTLKCKTLAAASQKGSFRLALQKLRMSRFEDEKKGWWTMDTILKYHLRFFRNNNK